MARAADPDLVLAKLNDAGLRVQVGGSVEVPDPENELEQVRDADPENPAAAAKLSVAEAEAPGDAISRGEDIAEIVTSGPPVPVSAIECGEPGALSAMVRAPERDPEPAGVKVSDRVQLAAGAREAGQVLVSPKSPALTPDREMLLMDKEAVPELVRMTVWIALLTPTGCAMNGTPNADSETAGNKLSWMTEKVFPAIVSVPVRAAPLLASMLNATVLLSEFRLPAVMCSHGELLTALHAQ